MPQLLAVWLQPLAQWESKKVKQISATDEHATQNDGERERESWATSTDDAMPPARWIHVILNVILKSE